MSECEVMHTRVQIIDCRVSNASVLMVECQVRNMRVHMSELRVTNIGLKTIELKNQNCKDESLKTFPTNEIEVISSKQIMVTLCQKVKNLRCEGSRKQIKPCRAKGKAQLTRGDKRFGPMESIMRRPSPRQFSFQLFYVCSCPLQMRESVDALTIRRTLTAHSDLGG